MHSDLMKYVILFPVVLFIKDKKDKDILDEKALYLCLIIL